MVLSVETYTLSFTTFSAIVGATSHAEASIAHEDERLAASVKLNNETFVRSGGGVDAPLILVTASTTLASL